MTNKHIGSSFDAFLAEEGLLDAAATHALQRLIDEGLNSGASTRTMKDLLAEARRRASDADRS